MNIFLSYAREDIALVEELAAVLNAAGHSVWVDTRLLPGEKWQAKLHEEIAKCDALAFLLTGHSAGSDWCDWEVASAVELAKSVIPIRGDATASIPARLQDTQFLDVSGGLTPIVVAKLLASLLRARPLPQGSSLTTAKVLCGDPERAWPERTHWSDRLTKVTHSHRPQSPSERIIDQFVAQNFKERPETEGKLILTDERLLFQAILPERSHENISIPLVLIERTEFFNPLFIPWGIRICCKDGQVYPYVLFQRKKLAEKIATELRPT